ncbi:MAG: hypothetical protein K6L76_05575 [Agarilytica sp.]
MKASEISKSIDKSLRESADALDALKVDLRNNDGKVSKQTEDMERRLITLQDELTSVSDKMLAYKLRRLADSKMLARVIASVQPLSSPPRSPSPVSTSSLKASKGKANKKGKSEKVAEFSSTTFQCKSDLDRCLSSSSSALNKALCYALFIRCAIKG